MSRAIILKLGLFCECEVAACSIWNKLFSGQRRSVWLSHGHRKFDFDALTALVKNYIHAATAKLNDAFVDLHTYLKFIFEAIENLMVANVLLSPLDELIKAIAVFAFQSNAGHGEVDDQKLSFSVECHLYFGLSD